MALQAGCGPGGAPEPTELTVGLGGGITMELVRVPPGSFLMGNPLDATEIRERFDPDEKAFDESYYADEYPQHEVTIASFHMGATEVTVAQFRRFVEETDYVTDAERGAPVPESGQAGERPGGYTVTDTGDWEWSDTISWRDPGYVQGDEHPVTVVSWNDAQAFSAWLATKVPGVAVRLPTEAEWEYAARGGTSTLYWWGDDPDTTGRVANLADRNAAERFASWAVLLPLDMNDGYLHAAPVRSYRGNPFGLHDMIGNVWEWCEDIWQADYWGAPTDGSAWLEERDPEHRVLRGGSWGNGPRGSRSSVRAHHCRTFRGGDFGFRVVAISPTGARAFPKGGLR
jgi:formylglycine-generating enzyme required for sulfatase activity